MKNEGVSFAVGFVMGMAVLGILLSFVGKDTVLYKNGRKDCMKEGFTNGYVDKVVTSNDEVLYIWKKP